MVNRSTRPTWRPDELKTSVEKAMRTMRGSDTPLNASNVAICAHRYTAAPKGVLERYIKDLSLAERIALGFPDPNAPPLSAKPVRDLGCLSRWRATQYRAVGKR